ncbi:hypothetical protein GCM10010448_69060 [Streptomyces glomeratus]|uniref:Uncharacterized protein n=1 Tax=Streptomyces glomeratus TaxID=284452 RepID=A0ABP6M4M6_9ACTN
MRRGGLRGGSGGECACDQCTEHVTAAYIVGGVTFVVIDSIVVGAYIETHAKDAEQME